VQGQRRAGEQHERQREQRDKRDRHGGKLKPTT
jgi:hypothetical protein